MRDVGDLGEELLHLWATQARINANKAHRDRTGWDFVLEFPTEEATLSASPLPLDRRAAPIQCFIQVKSSDRRCRRWPIKLSNWKRLVQLPSPTFILVLEFDGEDYCQRAFLIHIGEAYIRRVLRRLRELGIHETNPALHKHKLAVTYTSEDALPTTDANGLVAAIAKHVPDYQEYIQAKQDLLRSAGYEEGEERYESVVVLPRSVHHVDWKDILTDWSLGLIGPMEIKPGTKQFDERFGIRHPDPVKTIHSPGRALPKPFAKGIIRLRTLDGDHERAFEAEAYSTGSVAAFIGEDRQKIRIKTRWVDFLVPASGDMQHWQITMRGLSEFDARIPLSDFSELSDYVSILVEGVPEGSLELDVHLEPHRFGGTIAFPAPPDPDLVRLGIGIRSALRIAKRLKLSTSSESNLNQLFNQNAELELIDAALRSDTVGAKFEFAWHAGLTPPPSKGYVPVVHEAWIGRHRIVLTAVYSGHTEPTGAIDNEGYAYAFFVSSVCVSYVCAFPDGQGPEQSRIELMEAATTAYDANAVIKWWEHGPPNDSVPKA